MCGIAGWVSYDSDLTERTDVLAAMTATMACRGPDDSGTWVRPQVALGHRRLAILDLAGSRQPMCVQTPHGAVAMVYSGEVYNFVELREDLCRRGHRFGSTGDTEVVLRGYLEWGEGLVDHLNGMYAFAIWDERDRTLLMVRDRLGVKPFYYHRTRDGMRFGSEPKAILADPGVRRAVDLDGLRGLIASTMTPGWGFWKDIHEVEPGTAVTVSPAGIRWRRYWTLPTAPHTDDRDTTVRTVRELLTGVVHRQLVADVPRCVLLSGGLDSSAISGLAAAHLAGAGEQLRTFSVDFPGQQDGFVADAENAAADGPFVRQVVRRIGSDHRSVTLDPARLSDPALRRAVVSARDIPVANGELDTSLYLLFQAVRAESTVALSGESADEVFGGYRWFHSAPALAADTFPWLAFRKARSDARTAVLHPEIRRRLDLDTYIADQYAAAVAQVEHLPGDTAGERRMRTVCHLHLTRYVRMLLDRKDRVSMAVGLEVRVPYCDHRLVEYVYNAPWQLKTFDGREKSLLRHAAAPVLPSSVRDRLKSGYPTTQDAGYLAALHRQVRNLLADPEHPVFGLLDRVWLTRVIGQDPAATTGAVRRGIERALDFHHWVDLYRPEILAG
ncbi:MAG TPA: asparagine synthase (glutamine-hydrolyzing) [Nakamurella sp.]|nr:asparagine synthase (glutamine-hydrolyzing) [Nakamurella sp.]